MGSAQPKKVIANPEDLTSSHSRLKLLKQGLIQIVACHGQMQCYHREYIDKAEQLCGVPEGDAFSLMIVVEVF